MKNVRKFLAVLIALTLVMSLFTMGTLSAFADGDPATPTDLEGGNEGGENPPAKRTITWVVKVRGSDGFAVESTTTNSLEDGTSIADYIPDTPTVTAVDKIYTFDSWSPAPHDVDGDQTYVAQYTSTVRMYTITWITFSMGESGGLQQHNTSKDFEYGASLDGEFPALTQEFLTEDMVFFLDDPPWYPDSRPVDSDETYQAQYDYRMRTANITWAYKVQDGENAVKDTTTVSEDVEFGENAALFAPEIPTTLTAAEGTYTFDKWSPTPGEVNGEVTYTAQYTFVPITHTVTFKYLYANDEGTQVIEGTFGDDYNHGTELPPPNDPENFQTVNKVYTFTGWSPELSETVLSDQEYVAQYEITTRLYTITWTWKELDEDGSAVEKTRTRNLEYEESPSDYFPGVYDFETVDTIYTFKGWSPESHLVDGNETYVAQFETSPKLYAITWIWKELGEDGSAVDKTKDEYLPYNESLLDYFPGVFDFETVDTVYTFKGWSPEFRPVDGNEVYVAQFETSPKLYAITWIWKELGEDGSVVDQTKDEYLEYGESLLDYFPGVFDFETADTVYTFKGWSPEFRPVDGNEVYVAQFETSPRLYTITWTWKEPGEDGSVVEKSKNETLEYGESLLDYFPGVFDFETEEGYYKFIGWSPEFRPVDGDEDYVAQYEFGDKNEEYTITWVTFEEDGEGGLKEVKYSGKFHGAATLEGEFPAVEENLYTNTEVYTFTGWAPEAHPVSGDETYTALYDVAPRTYLVTWITLEENLEGELIEAITTRAFTYGASLEGEFPAVTPVFYTATETYVFVEWTPEPTAVTSDQVYRAVYEAQPIIPEPPIMQYAITWKNDAGDVIDVTMVNYGDMPTHADPTKAATAHYSYTFAGWTPEIVPATADATYTATFNSTVNRYRVTWMYDDGETVLEEQSVPYGKMPEYTGDMPTKEATKDYTYTFAGWTPEVVPVTGNAVYMATFTATAKPQPVRQPPLTPPERSAKMNLKFRVYYGETPEPLEKEPALVIEWGQASGVATYEIWAYYLDEEEPSGPRVTVNYGAFAAYVTDINGEKVDPSRNFVAFVVAKNRNGEEVGRTVIAYVAGPDSEYTNPASLAVTSEKSIKLEVGQSSTISASVTLEDDAKELIPGIPNYRYMSTNESVATVSESGEIIAVGKGSCTIQVYSKNGLVDEIKVTVK